MCFFLPLRSDPEKKKPHINKLIFGTHPVPGQSREFVYVYVFFLSLKMGLERIYPYLVSLSCLHYCVLSLFFSSLSGSACFTFGFFFWGGGGVRVQCFLRIKGWSSSWNSDGRRAGRPQLNHGKTTCSCQKWAAHAQLFVRFWRAGFFARAAGSRIAAMAR